MDSVKDDPKRAGFPHSDIFGSKLARSSPKLFAACHVLHRLLAPRHPPDALRCLRDRPRPEQGQGGSEDPPVSRIGTCLSEDDTSPPTSTATPDRPSPEGSALGYRDARRPASCGTMPRHRVMFQAPRLRRRRGSPHAPNGTMPSSSSPCRTATKRR